MKFTPSIVMYGSLATLGAGAHELIDDTPAVNTDSHGAYNIQRHLSGDSRYTYEFRMDLSTRLMGDPTDGSLFIDSCINWRDGVSPTNFTWYGINIQLPEDNKGIISDSWAYPPAYAQPLKEDGRVQLYNRTDKGVARYKFTTSTDRPVIRARINNGVFWNKFTFDFTDEQYTFSEQILQQTLNCVIEERDSGSTTQSFVQPTVTFALELLSRPTPAPTTIAPTLQPSDPSSSLMVGTVVAISIVASSSVFLLL